DGKQWSGAWNFGPDEGDAFSVADLVDMLIKEWGAGSWRAEPSADGLRESAFLGLDSHRAQTLLSWRPRLKLRDAIRLTVEWYFAAARLPAASMYQLTVDQLHRYEALPSAPGGLSLTH